MSFMSKSFYPATGFMLWIGMILGFNRHDAGFYVLTAIIAIVISVIAYVVDPETGQTE